jgi:hypothetical protein
LEGLGVGNLVYLHMAIYVVGFSSFGIHILRSFGIHILRSFGIHILRSFGIHILRSFGIHILRSFGIHILWSFGIHILWSFGIFGGHLVEFRFGKLIIPIYAHALICMYICTCFIG